MVGSSKDRLQLREERKNKRLDTRNQLIAKRNERRSQVKFSRNNNLPAILSTLSKTKKLQPLQHKQIQEQKQQPQQQPKQHNATTIVTTITSTTTTGGVSNAKVRPNQSALQRKRIQEKHIKKLQEHLQNAKIRTSESAGENASDNSQALKTTKKEEKTNKIEKLVKEALEKKKISDLCNSDINAIKNNNNKVKEVTEENPEPTVETGDELNDQRLRLLRLKQSQF
eukprot:Awhi_evm1s10739